MSVVLVGYVAHARLLSSSKLCFDNEQVSAALKIDFYYNISLALMSLAVMCWKTRDQIFEITQLPHIQNQMIAGPILYQILLYLYHSILSGFLQLFSDSTKQGLTPFNGYAFVKILFSELQSPRGLVKCVL